MKIRLQSLLTLLALGALILTSCGQATPAVIIETVVVTEKETQVVKETQIVKETAVVEVTPTSAGAAVRSGAWGEAPMLAAKVSAGELPPVEKRLPKNPGKCMDLLEEQIDLTLGQYGGNFDLVLQWGDASWNGGDPYAESNREALLDIRGNYPDLNLLYGNIAETWEMSDDQTEFTFRLREGMKWSDGEPVTTEDVRFFFEDVILNEELTPAIPTRYKHPITGNVAKLTVVDDYTFKYTFDAPYGGWLIQLGLKSLAGGSTDYMLPAHYFKRFHPKYTPLDQLAEQIEKEGFEPGEWWRLFELRYDRTPEDENLSMPLLAPWIRKSKSPTVTVFERNPYYWKVDDAGNQLPYVDTLTFHIVSDLQTTIMFATQGKTAWYSMDIKDVPLALENSSVSRLKATDFAIPSSDDLYLNWTYDDPTWREVVSNPKFREAFNLAIPRPAILELRFQMANPETIIPGEYNLEKANALLDEVLPNKDADGFRLGPNGKRFDIPIDTAAYGLFPKIAELTAESLNQVGLFSTAKTVEEGFYWESMSTNQAKGLVLWGMNGMWPLAVPDWSPVDGWFADGVAPLWAQYVRTNGEAGEQPPDWYMRLHEIYLEMAVGGDMEKIDSLWSEVEEIFNTYYPYFPTFTDIGGYIIHWDYIKNFPNGGPTVGDANTPAELYWLGPK